MDCGDGTAAWGWGREEQEMDSPECDQRVVTSHFIYPSGWVRLYSSNRQKFQWCKIVKVSFSLTLCGILRW